MEWIKVSMGTNPLYKQARLALEPHEAKVLASALEQPLKDAQSELYDLKVLRDRGEETTRQQDYRYLILEGIIDILGQFIPMANEVDRGNTYSCSFIDTDTNRTPR